MPVIMYREAIRDALAEEMRRDPRVFVMGEDIGVYGGVFAATRGLLREFGEDRVRDTPISEAALVGLGIGAALLGMRPVVELMYADFTAHAMDAIVNNAAKLHFMSGGQLQIPLTIRTPLGGGTGYAAQHSQCPENWFTHIPGLKVVTAATPADARGLLKAAIRDPNPVLFFEHKHIYTMRGPMPVEQEPIPLGVAEVKREGTDVTVVAWSMTLLDSLAAAARVAEEDGLQAEVIDPRTLQPLDLEAILKSVGKTKRLVVAHEAVRFAGFGGEIASLVTENLWGELARPVVRVGAKFAPIAFNERLEYYVIPTVDDIVAAIREAAA